MTRDDLIQLSVASGTASLVGAATVLLYNTGFRSEDVLAFSGTLIGAGSAVAGAAWLAERATTRERREEQSIIRGNLEALLGASETAMAAFPVNGKWTDEWRSARAALWDFAAGSARFLDEVIVHAKTIDFHQRETIKAARAHVGFFLTFSDDIAREGELAPWDERTWPGILEGVVTEVRSALATFRKS